MTETSRKVHHCCQVFESNYHLRGQYHSRVLSLRAHSFCIPLCSPLFAFLIQPRNENQAVESEIVEPLNVIHRDIEGDGDTGRRTLLDGRNTLMSKANSMISDGNLISLHE